MYFVVAFLPSKTTVRKAILWKCGSSCSNPSGSWSLCVTALRNDIPTSQHRAVLHRKALVWIRCIICHYDIFSEALRYHLVNLTSLRQPGLEHLVVDPNKESLATIFLRKHELLVC